MIALMTPAIPLDLHSLQISTQLKPLMLPWPGAPLQKRALGAGDWHRGQGHVCPGVNWLEGGKLLRSSPYLVFCAGGVGAFLHPWAIKLPETHLGEPGAHCLMIPMRQARETGVGHSNSVRPEFLKTAPKGASNMSLGLRILEVGECPLERRAGSCSPLGKGCRL